MTHPVHTPVVAADGGLVRFALADLLGGVPGLMTVELSDAAAAEPWLTRLVGSEHALGGDRSRARRRSRPAGTGHPRAAPLGPPVVAREPVARRSVPGPGAAGPRSGGRHRGGRGRGRRPARRLRSVPGRAVRRGRRGHRRHVGRRGGARPVPAVVGLVRRPGRRRARRSRGRAGGRRLAGAAGVRLGRGCRFRRLPGTALWPRAGRASTGRGCRRACSTPRRTRSPGGSSRPRWPPGSRSRSRGPSPTRR